MRARTTFLSRVFGRAIAATQRPASRLLHGVDLTMEVLVAISAGAAAGIASTAHCAAMCGPLAVGACGDLRPSLTPALRYGLGRLGAYTLTGTLAGALGATLLRQVQGTALHTLAAVAAGATLLWTAWRVVRSPGPAKAPALVPLRTRSPSRARAWALGALTALLPCGASASALLLAAAAGSALHGAATLSAFAARLGTRPRRRLVDLTPRGVEPAGPVAPSPPRPRRRRAHRRGVAHGLPPVENGAPGVPLPRSPRSNTLLSPRDAHTIMSTVLVALDSSSAAPKVLEAAVAQARHLGATLTLIRAVGLPTELPLEAYAMAPDSVADLLVKAAKVELGRHAEALPPGLLRESIAEVGVPWRVICDTAKRLESPMIVLGAHGHRLLDGLVGTTTTRVVNHADRPVLVVR
jgi:sulfite exporter TauE/SafE/nucleotide-binding universal stress UspA family protein